MSFRIDRSDPRWELRKYFGHSGAGFMCPGLPFAQPQGIGTLGSSRHRPTVAYTLDGAPGIL